MSDFTDIFLGEAYLESYCAFIGHKGLVFVEGLKDIPFWEGMLDDGSDIKYSFNHASHESTRGKTVLYKFHSYANRFALFAMDSDFDYICPNNSDKAISINSNKYIIQTLVYSKESVSLHHLVIKDCIGKIRITDSISFPIKEYIESYSEIIYEPLLRFLFQKERGVHVDDFSFHEEIRPEKPEMDENYKLTNRPFDLINENKAAIESAFKISDVPESEFIDFLEKSTERGLNKHTAAYFINGHFFEEQVVMPLINGIVGTFKHNELEKIKKECSEKPQQINDRKKELFSYIKNEISFSNILHATREKYKTPLSIAIINSL